MHLPTKFQLDKSKFACVRQFWKNSQKIQNLKKFERFNRFWPNLIPKFLDGCNIFVCSFRTIARILRKLELPRSKNSKSHKITNRASIVMKIVTVKRLWLLHWRTIFHIDISSRLWVIGVLNVAHRTHTHTHTHTHTSGWQLKSPFLDVLDYSEYSDTNISKKKFSRKHSFLSEESKNILISKLECLYRFCSNSIPNII